MSTLFTNPDYSEEFEDKPLPLNLYDEYDDEEDLWVKPRLENLVNGTLTPKQLAIEVDAMITQDTIQKHAELMDRPDPHNLTEEEEENETSIAPFPRSHIYLLFSAIVQLCTAFPAYHLRQTYIVEFLFALQSLPRHEVYTGLPPKDPSKPYQTMTLWPLEEDEGDWQMLSCHFQGAIKVWLAPYRLRNLNSAMARLAALKLCNCDRYSALLNIMPSSSEYLDLKERPIDGPNRLGNNLIAAAQWILPIDEGNFAYQECKKAESEPEWPHIWCMVHWREWKRQFAFVAGDERFAAKYREVAESCYRQMLAYESA